MKCFALESFNLSCQAELTKINSRLNFNPGLALIAFFEQPAPEGQVLEHDSVSYKHDCVLKQHANNTSRFLL